MAETFLPVSAGDAGESPAAREAPWNGTFEELYDEHADFVYRSLRRLGVPDSNADDALQEVFLVVHRRLAEYRGTAFAKTWLFRIAMHVSQSTRRSLKKHGPSDEVPSEKIADSATDPLGRVLEAERLRLLYRLLDELDDDKRAVFILAELEQMPVVEVADALSVNVNTLHARLRAARRSFEDAVARHRARTGRQP